MIRTAPPTFTTVPFPVWRTKVGHPLEVILTCAELVGSMTHWDGKTTLLCPGEATCSFCREHAPRRWQGFITAISRSTGEDGLVHLTPGVAAILEKVSAERRSMCGLACKFLRDGLKLNSPVRVTTYGWSHEVNEVSVSKLTSVVEKLFGTDADPLAA